MDILIEFKSNKDLDFIEDNYQEPLEEALDNSSIGTCTGSGGETSSNKRDISVVLDDEKDIEALKRVFADEGYQIYLQDQVNRQIIRDYLTNAVMLGILSEDRLEAFTDLVATEGGRAAMSSRRVCVSPLSRSTSQMVVFPSWFSV